MYIRGVFAVDMHKGRQVHYDEWKRLTKISQFGGNPRLWLYSKLSSQQLPFQPMTKSGFPISANVKSQNLLFS